MDVEKLPQTLTPPTNLAATIEPLFSCLHDCTPSHCQPGCSLEVVGELLSTPGALTGEEADKMLDLRQLLLSRGDAEAALRLFCELRLQLEPRHYLLLYRLRRWLENQIMVVVQPAPDAKPILVPLRLNFYCIEAVRRLCLCRALNNSAGLTAPRLAFAFVPLPKAK
jgi:hypothetical protein